MKHEINHPKAIIEVLATLSEEIMELKKRLDNLEADLSERTKQ